MDGVILPPSVVIATSNASLLNTIRCLGTLGNTDITVELFDFNGMSQDLETVNCVCVAINNLWLCHHTLLHAENLQNRSKDTATH